MARNVEIKARARDFQRQSELARKISHAAPTELVQEDTFFRCAAGRLKLRAFSDGHGELIHYERSDSCEPCESCYDIHPTPAPESMERILSEALGVLAVVRKRRTLLLAGRTRIHLDEVEGLGRFIELEVVLSRDEALNAGVEEARRLMAALEIAETDLVETAYVDLLLRSGTE